VQQDAISICIVAVDKFKNLKDIAFYIKHQYDKKYPGSGKAAEGVYHCAVGKSFASEFKVSCKDHTRKDTWVGRSFILNGQLQTSRSAEFDRICLFAMLFLSGAVSHETRQMIHLKIDTLHVILWKSKEAPFQITD
jgi:hypothetical protein